MDQAGTAEPSREFVVGCWNVTDLSIGDDACGAERNQQNPRVKHDSRIRAALTDAPPYPDQRKCGNEVDADREIDAKDHVKRDQQDRQQRVSGNHAKTEIAHPDNAGGRHIGAQAEATDRVKQ